MIFIYKVSFSKSNKIMVIWVRITSPNTFHCHNHFNKSVKLSKSSEVDTCHLLIEKATRNL